MNTWVFLQLRKVALHYFCNSCYICSSDTSVIHRLDLHVLSSIATIFTHIFIPSFSLRTPVKFLSFYSILLTQYSIVYFFFLVTLICSLISWSSTALLVMLKHFLILPILPASQKVVQMTFCFCIFKACFSCTSLGCQRVLRYFFLDLEGTHLLWYSVLLNFMFYFPILLYCFHSWCAELFFTYFQMRQVLFRQDIWQQNQWVIFSWSQSLLTQRMVEYVFWSIVRG